MKKQKILIIISVIILLAVAFFVIKNFTGKVVKDESDKELYLENNCECVKRENLKCPDEYDLIKDKNICEKVGEKCQKDGYKIECGPYIYYAPVLKSCSEYNCDGEIWRVK